MVTDNKMLVEQHNSSSPYVLLLIFGMIFLWKVLLDKKISGRYKRIALWVYTVIVVFVVYMIGFS